jgi:amino acid transporter
MFAFSRDGALPFSKYLYRVNKRTQTPVACVCALAFGAIILGLLTFAGDTAAGAVFIVAVVCAYISFSVPIVCRLVGGREFVPGPFSLGKLVSSTKYISMDWDLTQ